MYACSSFKLIINNECLVYIYSLDFALLVYVTKTRQFHVLQFWQGTGPISPLVVLALLQIWIKKIKDFYEFADIYFPKYCESNRRELISLCTVIHVLIYYFNMIYVEIKSKSLYYGCLGTGPHLVQMLTLIPNLLEVSWNWVKKNKKVF